MKLLLASKNEKKLRELEIILGGFLKSSLQGQEIELVSLRDFPTIGEIEEDGKIFEENAVKKALGYAKLTGFLTLADDSGLSVEALAGSPGVHSARFSGEGKSDLRNCEKLLELMKEIPNGKRKAKFECVIAIAEPERLIGVAKGEVSGILLNELRGAGGFGYDPLFYYQPFQKTFAEVSEDLKNSVSHRNAALKRSEVIIFQYLTNQKKESR